MDSTSSVELPRRPAWRWLLRFRLSTLLFVILVTALLLGWGIDHTAQSRRLAVLEEEYASGFPENQRASLNYFARTGNAVQLRANGASVYGDEELEIASEVWTLGVLYASDVTDDGMAHLERLHWLNWLAIHGPEVTDRGIEHIRYLRGLQSLKLRYTQISDKGMENIGGLILLRDLEIPETPITSAGIGHLRDLPHLRVLDISGNPNIDDKALEYAADLPILLHLDVRGTGVTDAGLRHVGRMQYLEYLDLSLTPIDGSGLGHLRNASRLHELLLHDTAIGDDDIDALMSLTQIRRLAIVRTNITPQGAAELQAALPDCVIVY
jgi:hypothetical protein